MTVSHSVTVTVTLSFFLLCPTMPLYIVTDSRDFTGFPAAKTAGSGDKRRPGDQSKVARSLKLFSRAICFGVEV